MTDGSDGEARHLEEVALERLFAWTRLCRVVGVASDAKKLVLALLGLIVFQAGRAGLDWVFPRPEPIVFGPERAGMAPGLALASGHLAGDLGSVPWRLLEPVRLLVEPFVRIFAL